MKRFLALLSMCVVASLAAGGADVLDRILAIVNNTPILLSDWDEAWRCEALLAGRTPESYSNTEQKEVFQRLVDQELLRQQMRSYLLAPVTAEEVQQELKNVRSQLSGEDDARWKSRLDSAGVTEEELTRRLRHEMEVERFLDVRFRAGIRVDDRTVSRYYRDEFLPEVRRAGGKEVPLEEVSGKIREIIVQQRMSEQANGWIQTLREQADIQIPAEVSSRTPEPGAAQSK